MHPRKKNNGEKGWKHTVGGEFCCEGVGGKEKGVEQKLPAECGIAYLLCCKLPLVLCFFCGFANSDSDSIASFHGPVSSDSPSRTLSRLAISCEGPIYIAEQYSSYGSIVELMTFSQTSGGARWSCR